MAYTNYDYYIETKWLSALYASTRQPTMKYPEDLTEPILILDGDEFWGQVNFWYQSPDPFWVTYVIRIRLSSGIYAYSVAWEYVLASVGDEWVGAYMKTYPAVFDSRGYSGEFDAEKEVYLGSRMPPIDQEFLITGDRDDNVYALPSGPSASWIQLDSSELYVR